MARKKKAPKEVKMTKDGRYKLKDGRVLALECDFETAKKLMHARARGSKRKRLGRCSVESASYVFAHKKGKEAPVKVGSTLPDIKIPEEKPSKAPVQSAGFWDYMKRVIRHPNGYPQ